MEDIPKTKVDLSHRINTNYLKLAKPTIIWLQPWFNIKNNA